MGSLSYENISFCLICFLGGFLGSGTWYLEAFSVFDCGQNCAVAHTSASNHTTFKD